MPITQPTLEDFYQAADRIHGTIRSTPLVKSDWLSAFTGCEIYLKLECLLITGSFKLRGATNKILSLGEQEKQRGVIAVSSGNHGRAVAYVARHHAIPAVICLPATVPGNKVAAIKDLGAEVLVTGATYDEATEGALQVKEQRGLTMIHPFDDPQVIAGQGTIGLEIMEQQPGIDTVIVPLSGGGLMGGIALAMKSINPSIQAVGVSMDQGAALIESLKAGKVVDIVEQPSLADALLGGLGSDNRHSFRICQAYVDQTALVSEAEIAAGMVFALEREHLVVEGGGAVGIAALLAGKVPALGQRVALVLSGGNVNLVTLIQVAKGSYPYQAIP